MVDYKIVGFNELDGQILVEFDPVFPPLTIDVPIKNGVFVSGDELNTYIQGFIPVWHVERVRQLKSGVSNANEIRSLVQEPTPVTVEEDVSVYVAQQQELENMKMREEEAFKQRVASVLVSLGVLEVNPTIIPVSQVE